MSCLETSTASCSVLLIVMSNRLSLSASGIIKKPFCGSFPRLCRHILKPQTVKNASASVTAAAMLTPMIPVLLIKIIENGSR